MFTVTTMTTSTAKLVTPAVSTAAVSIAAIDMERTLTQLPFWSSLTESEMDTLRRGAFVRHYEKGAFIHSSDTECLGMLFVLSGEIRTYLLSEEGREVTLFRLYPGQLCVLSASCVISQITFDTQMTAGSDTDVLIITAEATFTMKNICLAYGVSFMDLEVDVPVGKVKIRKVYCLQDSGKIINPQLAEGQMHGGVAMGIGYALGEQMLFDAATGRPLNNNLLDYKIPTCMDIPDMEIRFVETHEDSAPFGAKGLAEPPLIPQAAAVRNAILHATGVGMHKLPMNPQNLVHAFGEAGLIAQ